MAKRHDFSYFFHEGLSNMFSHGFMSFAAIGITVACLLIMGTFTLVAVNANELLTTLEQENEILAYVDDSYTETQARALKSRLEAIPNVASVTFISRDEAMEDFKAQYPDEELFQDLDPEILEDRYAIKLVDLEALADALLNGDITGAAIDSFEPLPLDNPIYRAKDTNLILTPHVAGGMRLEITRKNCIQMAQDNLRRYLAGEPLVNRVR